MILEAFSNLNISMVFLLFLFSFVLFLFAALLSILQALKSAFQRHPRAPACDSPQRDIWEAKSERKPSLIFQKADP